jgi:hypothetical protein
MVLTRDAARRRSAVALAVAMAVLLLASSAAAQVLPPDAPPPSAERVSLRLPLAIYASSAGADLFTTHQALQRDGFYELNPVGGWLDEHPTGLVVFSAAADAAVVWSLHRWLAPRHSRLLRVGLYAASGVRFWLAARNASAVRAYDRRMAAGR